MSNVGALAIWSIAMFALGMGLALWTQPVVVERTAVMVQAPCASPDSRTRFF